jgi:hypothetical protein
MASNDLRRLIEASEPVDVIWELLRGVWFPTDDVERYYREGEQRANGVERFIKDIFFEIYDLIYLKTKCARREFELPIILMDGLSIREGNLLVKVLEEKGYVVKCYSYGFSCLPSDTNTYSKIVFNASSPSAIRGDFYYERIEHGKVPSNPLEEDRFLLWITYPDEILHHAGRIIPPQDAFEMTKKVLLQTLQKIHTDKVIITSDHGYIFVDTVWPLSKAGLTTLKSIFGSYRFAPLSGIDKEVLQALKDTPKDLSYIHIDEEYCYVKGRYSWASGRQSAVSHGGLSLMECIVPRIEVKL